MIFIKFEGFNEVRGFRCKGEFSEERKCASYHSLIDEWIDYPCRYTLQKAMIECRNYGEKCKGIHTSDDTPEPARCSNKNYMLCTGIRVTSSKSACSYLGISLLFDFDVITVVLFCHSILLLIGKYV